MAVGRHHPFVSPLGCGAAVVFIIGVAVVALFSGGAQFSPGALSAQAEAAPLGGFASHAEFENDCRQCHVPFQGVDEARCEACHTGVAEERAQGKGLHGSRALPNTERCEDCHREHEGREFDLTADARQRFDHSGLDFVMDHHLLDYAAVPLAERCQACHTGAEYTVEAGTCVSCHGAHDQIFMLDHAVAFGQGCLTCHDGVDRMAGFDHAGTDFALHGQHAQVACSRCHSAAVPAGETPAACVDCHAEPEAHAGLFGTDCAACHSQAAWTPAELDNALFNHADTGFALTSHTVNYDGSPLTCRDCHTGQGFALDQQTCVDCHGQADAAFMTEHLARFGANCLGCHDGTGNMANFDHDLVFPLDGAHAVLGCEACHTNQQFAGTSSECVACHAEPAVHAGLFGTNCAACHTTTGWTPARLTQHSFPLNHGGTGEVACATCHPGSYVAYTCYGCHEHQPAEMIEEHEKEGIVGDRLNDCAACHPSGQKD